MQTQPRPRSKPTMKIVQKSKYELKLTKVKTKNKRGAVLLFGYRLSRVYRTFTSAKQRT